MSSSKHHLKHWDTATAVGDEQEPTRRPATELESSLPPAKEADEHQHDLDLALQEKQREVEHLTAALRRERMSGEEQLRSRDKRIHELQSLLGSMEARLEPLLADSRKCAQLQRQVIEQRKQIHVLQQQLPGTPQHTTVSARTSANTSEDTGAVANAATKDVSECTCGLGPEVARLNAELAQLRTRLEPLDRGLHPDAAAGLRQRARKEADQHDDLASQQTGIDSQFDRTDISEISERSYAERMQAVLANGLSVSSNLGSSNNINSNSSNSSSIGKPQGIHTHTHTNAHTNTHTSSHTHTNSGDGSNKSSRHSSSSSSSSSNEADELELNSQGKQNTDAADTGTDADSFLGQLQDNQDPDAVEFGASRVFELEEQVQRLSHRLHREKMRSQQSPSGRHGGTGLASECASDSFRGGRGRHGDTQGRATSPRSATATLGGDQGVVDEEEGFDRDNESVELVERTLEAVDPDFGSMADMRRIIIELSQEKDRLHAMMRARPCYLRASEPSTDYDQTPADVSLASATQGPIDTSSPQQQRMFFPEENNGSRQHAPQHHLQHHLLLRDHDHSQAPPMSAGSVSSLSTITDSVYAPTQRVPPGATRMAGYTTNQLPQFRQPEQGDTVNLGHSPHQAAPLQTSDTAAAATTEDEEEVVGRRLSQPTPHHRLSADIQSWAAATATATAAATTTATTTTAPRPAAKPGAGSRDQQSSSMRQTGLSPTPARRTLAPASNHSRNSSNGSAASRQSGSTPNLAGISRGRRASFYNPGDTSIKSEFGL